MKKRKIRIRTVLISIIILLAINTYSQTKNNLTIELHKEIDSITVVVNKKTYRFDKHNKKYVIDFCQNQLSKYEIFIYSKKRTISTNLLPISFQCDDMVINFNKTFAGIFYMNIEICGGYKILVRKLDFR